MASELADSLHNRGCIHQVHGRGRAERPVHWASLNIHNPSGSIVGGLVPHADHYYWERPTHSILLPPFVFHTDENAQNPRRDTAIQCWRMCQKV